MNLTFLEKLYELHLVENSILTDFFSHLPFQEEGEVPSDQSLKEFEGATLRYASINLKYAP